MEDQYGMIDLRQYITGGTPLFRQPQPEFTSGHQGLSLNPPNNPYGMLMFRTDSNNSVTTGNAMAAHGGGGGGSSSGGRFIAFESGDNVSSGRWPRQETLTLLEIRSRLNHKFKEANQKGPLWDEISRIMSEEYGYQRSGKKCREKFENLYKYYKKTKEGKAGRQDGKHYRFFRQLEALYGEPYNLSSASASVPNPLGETFLNKNSCSLNREGLFEAGSKLSDTSLSLSNYSDADMSCSSGDDNSLLNDGIKDANDLNSRRIRGKKGWKVKIRDLIDGQMKKLMDKQEAWMEGMMRTMEDKEQQRLQREDQWRKQDAARIERERELWASERAWIEARDAALMEALHKMSTTGNQEINTADIQGSLSDHGSDRTMPDSAKGGGVWLDSEVNRLIELRSDMDLKFHQQRKAPGDNQAVLWEELSRKMACFGYHKSGRMCKEKWEETVGSNISYLHKKRIMEMNSKPCIYNPIYHQGIPCSQGFDHHTIRLNDDGNSSSPQPNDHTDSSSATAAVNDHCFRYLMGETYARLLD